MPAAFDNGDYGQENASKHVTNTVLYQYIQDSFVNVNRITQRSHKNRQKSINTSSEKMDELRVTKKPDLSDFYSNKLISFNAKLSMDFITSQYTKPTWTLLSHVSTNLSNVSCKQIVPGWTDVRKLVSLKIPFPTTIGNCRFVPTSPTDVLHKVLHNIKHMLQNI